MALDVVPLALMWVVWRERDKRAFEGIGVILYM